MNSIIRTALPPAGGYTQISLHSAIFDDLMVLGEDIVALEAIKHTQYSEKTVIYASFNGTIEGGSITNNSIGLTHWRILRKNVGDHYYSILADIPANTERVYLDKTPCSGRLYDYAVSPMAYGIEGSRSIGQGSVDFDGWRLSDKDGSIDCDIDVVIDPIVSNIDFQIQETRSSYPIILHGSRHYETGGIGAFPFYFEDNNVRQSVDTVKKFCEFINKPGKKLLRNAKGDSWVVETRTVQQLQRNNYVSEDGGVNPSSLTFSWIEVGSPDDLSFIYPNFRGGETQTG